MLPVCVRLLFVLAAFPLNAHAGGLQAMSLGGQAITPAGPRDVQLNVFCRSDRDGMVGLQLLVLDAEHVTGFDFAPFEGPDAPAGEKALSRIQVSSRHRNSHSTLRAGGWYSADVQGAFVLGVSQRSHRRGAVARLLRDMLAADARLSWTQLGFGNTEVKVEASFALNATQQKRLRTVVRNCLPPPVP